MIDRYIRLFTKIVDDPEFHALSPSARLLFYTLKPALGRIGIGSIYPGQLEIQSGLDAERVESAAVELEDGNWLIREGHIWWLRNGLRFEEVNSNNTNQSKGLVNKVNLLPDAPIVRRFREYYSDTFPRLSEGSSKGLRRVFEGSSKPVSRAKGDPSKGALSMRGRERGRKRERTAITRVERAGCGLTPCLCHECPMPTETLLDAWQTRFPTVTERDRNQNRARAVSITSERSREEIMAAVVGIEQLFPYDQKGGRPWDLRALEKNFALAVAASQNHPDVKAKQFDREWDAMYEGQDD